MIFEFLASLFTPAASLIEKIVTKDNDKIALKNQLAQIEAQVATKLMELQVKALEMQSAVAVAEQQSGNLLSKSWRPIVSIIFAANILVMGYGLVPYNELIIQVSGMFLGIYGIGRSLETKMKFTVDVDADLFSDLLEELEADFYYINDLTSEGRQLFGEVRKLRIAFEGGK